MNKYQIIVYNDGDTSILPRKVTVDSFVAEDKDRAREYGNRVSEWFFKGLVKTSVHVIYERKPGEPA